MKIIDRHIGWSVLLTTLFGVAVLSLVLVLGNVFQELMDLMINRNLPLQSVFFFMWQALPFSLTFTIPWALLASTLLLFGRMSADHELVALQTCGVSVPRLCAPVFLVALALSGVCLWINVEAAPRALQRMLTAISDFAQSNPMALFVPNDVVDQFPGRKMYIGGKDGQTLTDIIIFETTKDNIPTRMIFARKANIDRDHRTGGLLVRLEGARFEDRDPQDPLDVVKIRNGLSFDQGTCLLSPDKRVGASAERKKGLSARTLAELSQFMAEGADGDLSKAKVEYHRRFSMAMACLAFTLLGVPLGTILHRKETSASFGISLVAAFTYFLFIILAQTFQSSPQAHPVFLMWLPNILFGIIGGSLFIRLGRP